MDGHGDDQPTRHIAQQDGHKGAHLHHAVAAGQLALAQHLGQQANLTGPNSVECTPIKKVQPSRTGTLALKKPQAASAMMTISRFFTKMISSVLSYLSASCPLVALKTAETAG
jgi:hypothetical protein